jgi:nucleotide-binding universal stress UspA family protein
MAERILVPYDDSEQATAALEHALDRYPEAEIVALHVIDVLESSYSGNIDGTLPGYWEEWYEVEEQRTETLFEEAQSLADDYEVDLETESVVGRPSRSINEYAEEHDVDHIIIGSHGRTGVGRILLGSVAETVVRRAPCPVTVVR